MNAKMKNIAFLIAAMAISAALFAYGLIWMNSQPTWQLSARNTREGVTLEVFKSNSDYPTYQLTFEGATIDQEFDRCIRNTCPRSVVESVSWDETLGPGRWKIRVLQTDLDIMERGLSVNGKTEICPRK